MEWKRNRNSAMPPFELFVKQNHDVTLERLTSYYYLVKISKKWTRPLEIAMIIRPPISISRCYVVDGICNALPTSEKCKIWPKKIHCKEFRDKIQSINSDFERCKKRWSPSINTSKRLYVMRFNISGTVCEIQLKNMRKNTQKYGAITI